MGDGIKTEFPMPQGKVVVVVKNPPAKAGDIRDAVRSLGQENPLEEEMATTTSVFLPGESHGQRSLVGYSPWGHKKTSTHLGGKVLE